MIAVKEIMDVATTFNLKPSELEYIRIIAKDNGCTQSEVIRYAVRQIIKKYKKLKGITDATIDDIED
jgi:hypothetical protein